MIKRNKFESDLMIRTNKKMKPIITKGNHIQMKTKWRLQRDQKTLKNQARSARSRLIKATLRKQGIFCEKIGINVDAEEILVL